MKLFFVIFLLLLIACGSSSTKNSPVVDEFIERVDNATAAADGKNELYKSYAETAQAEDAADPYSQSNKCISWKEAFRHIGETTCVTGTVTSVYNSGKAFFINFSSNRTSFYLVSFDFTWNNLPGNCIVAHGDIVEYEKRAEIILRKTSQLEGC